MVIQRPSPSTWVIHGSSEWVSKTWFKSVTFTCTFSMSRCASQNAAVPPRSRMVTGGGHSSIISANLRKRSRRYCEAAEVAHVLSARR